MSTYAWRWLHLEETKRLTYFRSETPSTLIEYRKQELVNLRGDGKGKLEKWDRVYDHSYCNDLGDLDKGSKYVRPVLGGSSNYLYPRRRRTCRPPTKTGYPFVLVPLLMSFNIYVPRDERFGHLKMSDFLACALKFVFNFLFQSLRHYLIKHLMSLILSKIHSKSSNEESSYQRDLYLTRLRKTSSWKLSKKS
ncbi:hypothetical protein HYC85_010167 [Camellia sinensis]|uniref:Lipoxygenase domain-containing protein n=1 Tax=Camellia sinensis TaxID=4442 RepID=A0A7J7HHB4_CAMSI|nr:hypothetical protein HYC85_010167 [Camellia sinensis]